MGEVAIKRLSYEFVRESFESEGYTLLSKEYKNNYTKLEYICPEGHEHSIAWGHWASGKRCRFCKGNPIITIDGIRKSFESEGYTLLTTTYKTAHSKLEYVCPKGHLGTVTWANWFSAGNRCWRCAINKHSKLRKLSFDVVKHAFEKEGYSLLSKVYVSAKDKLDYICPKGHQHLITWDNFRTGYRCPYCSGRPIITIEDVRISFEKEGYTLLSTEYKNVNTKLDYICPKGHIHKITWGSWQSGSRCGICISVNRYGENHPGWKGGRSRHKYCPIWNNKDYKESIKERDGYSCLNPYCTKENTVITIHHVDYDKINCSPDNLITVCSSCNSRANKDREWHKAWYQAILNKRYKYKY